MADVKWIKISTGIFNDEAFEIIDDMPEADAIELIWFKLLVFAGKQNNNGLFLFKDSIAYTDEMLASVFHRPLNIIRLAMTTFMNLGMIEQIDGVYAIPNWDKYQSGLDAYEKKKERDREYSRQRREKLKTLAKNSLVDKNESVEFSEIKKIFSNKCAYCGEETKLTIDHFIAIDNGGTDSVENIVPSCIRCNCSKGNKNFDEWYKNQEFFNEERLDFLKNYLKSQNSRQTVERFCSYSYSISNSNISNLNYLLNSNTDYIYISNNTNLLNILKEWLEYKQNKGKQKLIYTESSLNKLLKKFIDMDMKYGTDAIQYAVNTALENGWVGIVWDKAENFNKFTKNERPLTQREQVLDTLLKGIQEGSNE